VEIYDCQLAGNFPVSKISAEERERVDAGELGPSAGNRRDILSYKDYQQDYENVDNFPVHPDLGDEEMGELVVDRRKRARSEMSEKTPPTKHMAPMSVQVTTGSSYHYGSDGKNTTTTVTFTPHVK